jgi:hypothetical protein
VANQREHLILLLASSQSRKGILHHGQRTEVLLTFGCWVFFFQRFSLANFVVILPKGRALKLQVMAVLLPWWHIYICRWSLFRMPFIVFILQELMSWQLRCLWDWSMFCALDFRVLLSMRLLLMMSMSGFLEVTCGGVTFCWRSPRLRRLSMLISPPLPLTCCVSLGFARTDWMVILLKCCCCGEFLAISVRYITFSLES